MKKIYYLLAITTTILLSACSKHSFAPALYKNDMAYQFKPMSTDEQKDATYISAALNLSGGANANYNDQVVMGQLSFDRANTFENLNVTYGAYGFLGSYQNTTTQTTDPGYFNTKSFAGYGFRGSANVYAQSGNMDLRLFGVAAAFSQESGAYSDFRKYAQNLPGYYTDASQSIFTAGFTNEISWKMERNHDIQLGYRIFAGGVFGDHRYVNANDPNSYNSIYDIHNRFTISGSFFTQIQRYTMVAELQNFDAFTIRLGFRF